MGKAAWDGCRPGHHRGLTCPGVRAPAAKACRPLIDLRPSCDGLQCALAAYHRHFVGFGAYVFSTSTAAVCRPGAAGPGSDGAIDDRYIAARSGPRDRARVPPAQVMSAAWCERPRFGGSPTWMDRRARVSGRIVIFRWACPGGILAPTKSETRPRNGRGRVGDLGPRYGSRCEGHRDPGARRTAVTACSRHARGFPGAAAAARGRSVRRGRAAGCAAGRRRAGRGPREHSPARSSDRRHQRGPWPSDRNHGSVPPPRGAWGLRSLELLGNKRPPRRVRGHEEWP